MLTKDRAIRTRRLERETLFAASVRAVILTAADLTGSEMAKIFLDAVPKILRKVAPKAGRVIYLLTRGGALSRLGPK